jgi:hypothetical protein
MQPDAKCCSVHPQATQAAWSRHAASCVLHPEYQMLGMWQWITGQQYQALDVSMQLVLSLCSQPLDSKQIQ